MKTVISVTDAACAHIHQLYVNNPHQLLKLGVNNKGCSGHSYTYDWIAPDQVQKSDEQVSVGDHHIILDGKSVFKLLGSTLDYHTDMFGSKFVWHNPAVKNTCGCGESVAF